MLNLQPRLLRVVLNLIVVVLNLSAKLEFARDRLSALPFNSEIVTFARAALGRLG
jgi:hypothetical protein